MNLTELIDKLIARMTLDQIRVVAKRSWGKPKLKERFLLRILETILASVMPRPELDDCWISNGLLVLCTRVTYRDRTFVVEGRRDALYPRTNLLFNAATRVLKK